MTSNVVVSVLRAKFVKKLIILPDVTGIESVEDVGWKADTISECVTVRSSECAIGGTILDQSYEASAREVTAR